MGIKKRKILLMLKKYAKSYLKQKMRRELVATVVLKNSFSTTGV